MPAGFIRDERDGDLCICEDEEEEAAADEEEEDDDDVVLSSVENWMWERARGERGVCGGVRSRARL